MGWKQSPPLFTAVTETVADLANIKLCSRQASIPHRLDAVSETLIAPELNPPRTSAGPKSLPLPTPALWFQSSKPIYVKSWDVNVDDFIGMVQGSFGHRQQAKRILLTPLDKVLRRLDAQDNFHRQEMSSVKKMLKGDATWATRKIVLGWLLDTCSMTIQFPSHQVVCLFELLESITPKQRRTTVNKWQKLLGELWSMVLVIRGGGFQCAPRSYSSKVRSRHTG
jgi:hypothetical protein